MIGFLASFWMIGNILTAAIAWIIIPKVRLGGYIDTLQFGSWRIFVVIGSFPALSSALLFLCLPESPKYLYMVISKFLCSGFLFITLYSLGWVLFCAC